LASLGRASRYRQIVGHLVKLELPSLKMRAGSAMYGRAEDFDLCRVRAAAPLRPIRLWFSAFLSIVAAMGAAHAQPIRAGDQVFFDIPAQPLSRALIAYSAATGLEIFYKAALAENRHSGEVAGVMTPSVALEALLRGTGYAARTTGLGAFTLVQLPLEPYFAAIQVRVDEALCRYSETPAQQEILFQFWLAPSGVIARAEIIGRDGSLAGDQSLAAALRGVAIGTPPAGMPQPVNMVVFPPSRASTACRTAGGREPGRVGAAAHPGAGSVQQ
jgi:hypothetical protein